MNKMIIVALVVVLAALASAGPRPFPGPLAAAPVAPALQVPAPKESLKGAEQFYTAYAYPYASYPAYYGAYYPYYG